MSVGPYLQHADAGVTVVWYTDSPTGGSVRWRTDEGTAGEAASSAALATRHEAVIAPLVPGARFTYRVYSTRGLLAAAGGEAEFSFQAPRPDVLRLVAFGDSGENSPGQHAVARAIAAEAVPPDLVVILGDVYQPPPAAATPPPGGAAAYASSFFGPYRTLLPAVPFYAVVGNHDYEVEKGRAFFDLFTLPRNGPPGLAPESSWWLERAGVLMIAHDTNQSPAAVEAKGVPWHAEVAARPAAFRLVLQHHALYSSGPNGASESGALRERLAPLYTRTGVDVVLSGHDHFYERTRPIGGVVYVTTGAGGGALYPRTTDNAFTEAFVNDRHSYTYVEARGRTMLLRQTDTSGRTIDSLTITKP
jgi:3',5'-cyclic AMP phosphodiesterase CpdA